MYEIETVYQIADKCFYSREKAEEYRFSLLFGGVCEDLSLYDENRQPMPIIQTLRDFVSIGNVYYVEAKTEEASKLFYEMYTKEHGYTPEGLEVMVGTQRYNDEKNMWEGQ